MAWRAAKSLLTLRDQINAKWPDRNKASDGLIGDAAHASRSSDHNPWVKDGSMGVVTALDITHDPAHGVDCNRIAEAIKHDKRIKYVIWNRKIWNPSKAKAWRSYSGKNPHTKHFHVSVLSTKSAYDGTQPWDIGSSAPLPLPMPTPTPPKPLLKKGSMGEVVKELQTILIAKGYDLGKWGADGDFGKATLAAVRQFQTDKGLVVDGKAGPYTWESLLTPERSLKMESKTVTMMGEKVEVEAAPGVKNWRMLAFNAGVAVMVAFATWATSVDWTQYLSPTFAMLLLAGVNVVLRFFTSGPAMSNVSLKVK